MEETEAVKTIAEQWGDKATPKNCFEVLPMVGTIDSG